MIKKYEKCKKKKYPQNRITTTNTFLEDTIYSPLKYPSNDSQMKKMSTEFT